MVLNVAGSLGAGTLDWSRVHGLDCHRRRPRRGTPENPSCVFRVRNSGGVVVGRPAEPQLERGGYGWTGARNLEKLPCPGGGAGNSIDGMGADRQPEHEHRCPRHVGQEG
jgi:hypothetical protein